MLLMKKKFLADIRAGVKSTTLRFWRWCHVSEGSLQTVPGLGKVRINSAECVQIEDLTDEDARADGFDDLRALQQALGELYPPEKRAGRKLYQISFTLMSDPGQP